MAVKASASITLVTSVDVDSVYWFYKAQASTAAAPAKPTTVPTKGSAPSGWSLAEPTTVDINQTLYRVELTYFTDGTGIYSTVSKVSSYEGAKVAYNKAQAAQDSVDDAYSKLQSRGEQLVVNGSAFLGDNTNFSTWTYDGSVANGTKGSFTKPSTYAGTPLTDEMFPVDITKRYRFEFDAISKNKTARHYSFLNFYDVDGNPITAGNHMYVANTLTTLAQELKNGDTVVYLTSTANWSVSSSTATHMLGFIFWNYTNNKGYTYPENTYSRNVWTNLYTYDKVNKTNNTITLTSAWNHGTFPAGTKVSQSRSGGNYKYGPLANSLVETTWTHYASYFDGTDYSGGNVGAKFPPGTATAKVGFLWNYQSQSTTDQLWITNVSVMEDLKTSISTAQAAAANAQAAADSKKSMIKINTASRSFTTANWKIYGAVGHSENWTTGSSYSNPNIKVGDTAYLIGTVSDGAKGTATIIGTVTAVNGTNGTTSITMTSQQLIFGGDSVDNVNSTANTAKSTADTAKSTADTAKSTADAAKTAADSASTTATNAKTAADNALINTKYNGPVNVGAAITANRLIMNTATGANTAASYKMVAKNTAYNIESPILYSTTALSTGNIAVGSHSCYLISNVSITGQGGVSSLTVNRPVFLKGTLSGSTFTTTNDANFITMTQPTSSDNYHYIFLGTATSTTNILLQAEHPVYMFTGGSFHRIGLASDKIIQEWVGGAATTIANAKLNGSYIQANTITGEHIYVEDLNAIGATIGGFEIGEDSIHTAGSTSDDIYENAIWLCGYANGAEEGFARKIGGTNRSGLVFAIGGDFAVDYDGWLYASHAIINGASEIAGFTIDGTSIRTKSVAVTSNASNSVSLSSADFTRTLSGTSRANLRFAIGSHFGVTNTGIVYAGSGTIGKWNIGATSTATTTAQTNGSLYYGTFGSANSIYLIPTGTTTSTTIAGRAGTDWRFAVGSTFGVTSGGALYATGTATFKYLVTTGNVVDYANNAAGIRMYRWDHMVGIDFEAVKCSAIYSALGNSFTLATGFRPRNDIWTPCAINNGSNKYYLGVIYITTGGVITIYGYSTYGAAPSWTINASSANSTYANYTIYVNLFWYTNNDPV